MDVMGSQEENTPTIFISELLPLFCKKNNIFDTQRIELKLLTNVYINVWDEFTNEG